VADQGFIVSINTEYSMYLKYITKVKDQIHNDVYLLFKFSTCPVTVNLEPPTSGKFHKASYYEANTKYASACA
jgi:hypothetical protein